MLAAPDGWKLIAIRIDSLWIESTDYRGENLSGAEKKIWRVKSWTLPVRVQYRAVEAIEVNEKANDHQTSEKDKWHTNAKDMYRGFLASESFF